MITEPLSFTGTLTLQDALDLHHYHFRYILRWSIRVVMALFSLLIAAVIVFVGIRTYFTATSVVFLALCAYYPFGWFLHRRLAVSWRYRCHSEHFIEGTATFTNDSVSLSSVQVDLRLNWDRLAAIISTPRGLLIVARPDAAWFWLPQRLFDGNSHKEAIEELAVEHQLPIRRIT